MVMMICSITLTGCQLAMPTINTNVTSDKLCGAFVTIGYYDLAINNEALNDIDVSFNSKGEAIFDEGAFSTLSENRIEGKITEDKSNVIFDGIQGYYMGILHQPIENGEYSNAIMCDPGLSDVKFAVNVTDNSENQTGEATLYVSTKFQEIFYLNPVYLTSDGSYYTILGRAQGASFSGDISGSVCSQTLDSEITQTNDGSSKTEQSSYKINVAVVDEVKKTTIKEMNQNDELLKTTEYMPDSPDEFTVDSKTAYVIVEELLSNSSKENYAKRNIYIPLPLDSTEATNQHSCNFPGENNVIAQKHIKFIYE